MQALNPEDIRRAVQAALAEDIGSGDVTSLSTVPEHAQVTVVMQAREVLVAAGLAAGGGGVSRTVSGESH